MASTLPTFNDVQNYTGTLAYTEGAATTDSGWFKVASITALRALASSDENKLAIVDDIGGYGRGAYAWDADSTDADDGLLVIDSDDGGTGRWVRFV